MAKQIRVGKLAVHRKALMRLVAAVRMELEVGRMLVVADMQIVVPELVGEARHSCYKLADHHRPVVVLVFVFAANYPNRLSPWSCSTQTGSFVEGVASVEYLQVLLGHRKSRSSYPRPYLTAMSAVL